MKSKIHYILGLGRSGSTLLTTILNDHNDIKGIPEIPLIIYFLHRFNKNKRIDFNDYAVEYLKLYQEIRPINIVNLHADEVQPQSENQDYLEYCESIYSHFEINGCSGNTPIYLDKNPPYTFHYEKLTNLSPESKFIILVRDYRANVLSRKQKPYAKTGNVVYNSIRWNYFHKEILKFYKNNNCLLVRYEDLINNIEEQLKVICDFFEIDYNGELLDYQKIDFSKSEIKSGTTNDFAKAHFKGLNQNINKNRIEAWKTELTKKEIYLSEAICGTIGDKFNYQKSTESKGIAIIKMKYFHLFVKAYIAHVKEKLTFYLPIKFKMKRLKKSLYKLK